MNLRRHLAVLWRFRMIIVVGVMLGITLATLALFRIGTGGIEWRTQETWTSQASVFVTQQGFPWGRVILTPPPTTGATPTAPQPTTGQQVPAAKNEAFADPQRFTNLAIVYSYLAQSDRVRALMNPRPKRSQLTVTPVNATANSSETLPLLNVQTNATSPEAALRLNGSAISALQRYLASEQAANKISRDDRVRIQVLNPPSEATILVGRSKTPAIVAFILALAGALALAYCLDNLYPRAPFRDARTGEGAPALEEVWSAPPAPGHEATRAS